MKSVCMFVWNHFTNDARVLRECSALAEAGYEVDLIALQDPKNKSLPKEEMRPEGFRVIRVKRQPSILVNALKFSLRKDLHALLDLPKDEKILLYQGGIQAGRGLEQLVLAAKDFKEGTLVMIGDGKLKPTIQQLIETEGVADRVKMIDKVPVEALPYYTMNAYLGFQVLNNVCFNHYSASSNKLFEYLMAEVPVVSCDFPEIERVVAGNDVGVLVDSHDPKSIADGVNRMIEDQALYARVKENTKTAREKYNWDLEKEALLNVYADAAERKLPIMKDGAPKPVQA